MKANRFYVWMYFVLFALILILALIMDQEAMGQGQGVIGYLDGTTPTQVSTADRLPIALAADGVTTTPAPGSVQEIEGDEAEGSGSLPNPVLICGDDGVDCLNYAAEGGGRMPVNLIPGRTGIAAGAGVSNVDTPRMTLASDQSTVAVRMAGNDNAVSVETRKTVQWASIDVSLIDENTIIAAPGAGLAIYIVHLSVVSTVDTAQTFTLLDGATAINGAGYSGIRPGYTLDVPAGFYLKLTDNQAFVIKSVAATNLSGTAIYYVE